MHYNTVAISCEVLVPCISGHEVPEALNCGSLLLRCRYLVDCGAIKPLCDLLSTPDVRIVTVALEGLENILKVSHCCCRVLHCWPCDTVIQGLGCLELLVDASNGKW